MVNATQLSSFMYCPRKLFIKDVLLIEEPKKEALVKGTVWHRTFEIINKNDERIVLSIRTKNYPDILDLYKAEYAKFLRNSILHKKSELKEFNIGLTDLFKEYWPSFEEEAKKRSLNISRFIEEHNVFGKELWEKLTPKILSEQKIVSETLNLTGIIDVIEVHDNKIYVPVELKTGRVPEKGIWDTHKVQLASYALLLEDQGKTVTEAVMQYKDTEARVLQINTLLKEEVKDLIKEVDSLLKTMRLPEKVKNKNKCISCFFKKTCYNDSEMERLMEEARNRKL